ncbi:hypothetical protein Psi02_53480 [Planotetraspora silvatica]|uniref:DUF302 domain-containing protein n=1 Tax=Planotetraspora silvatica TaxID=234614 RepID=A0A8J3UN07_9ACTN|nr:DUF302 domain-containing protein [Planotetraspora silvatica]GII48924.1 hypothetical protein Psi02_53480 [Planotetraspora silvatica]
MSDLEKRISAYGHAETVRRLEQEIGSRGATIYGRVDHAANAVSAGMRMPPTVVLIFGNPRGGTLIMQSAPAAAYDLPLRVLVREAGPEVLVEYRRPELLAAAFGLTAEAVAPLHVIDEIVLAATAPPSPEGRD